MIAPISRRFLIILSAVVPVLVALVAVFAFRDTTPGQAVAADQVDDVGEYSDGTSGGQEIDGLRSRGIPAISRAQIIENARFWVDRGVTYDASAYNSVTGPDGRKYTPDCSGFGSMAWRLGTSYGSASLPGVGVRLSSTRDLRQGDLLVAQKCCGKKSGHVAIFDRWADSGRTAYFGYDLGIKGKPVAYKKFSVQRPGDPRTYVGYRHPNLTDAGSTPTHGTVDADQPVGDINSATGARGSVTLWGWAADPDTPRKPISVHVYLVHPNGHRQYMRALTANQDRADVAKVYPHLGAAHGYSTTLTGLARGAYQVEVYAIDSSNQAGDYAQLLSGGVRARVPVTVS